MRDATAARVGALGRGLTAATISGGRTPGLATAAPRPRVSVRGGNDGRTASETTIDEPLRIVRRNDNNDRTCGFRV
ncbi:hypothetical protein A6E15_14230 [Natrinema saccharevitans]|uniref:Uncharacterized protein n=1 Tax=Natrinema saccharevitans TaxID=301967 RepID=A0A1S8AZL1_9EURY|nr:hypothetical protein A6E15_14230 [Natrinema saccharevitans]